MDHSDEKERFGKKRVACEGIEFFRGIRYISRSVWDFTLVFCILYKDGLMKSTLKGLIGINGVSLHANHCILKIKHF